MAVPPAATSLSFTEKKQTLDEKAFTDQTDSNHHGRVHSLIPSYT